MTSTAGDLNEIAGRYRSSMQRRGDERAGGTGLSQGLEIGEMAHASRRVDAARAGSSNDRGNPLQVRSLARADARERHDDDTLRPKGSVIEQRLRAHEAVAAEIEGESEEPARLFGQPPQVIVGEAFRPDDGEHTTRTRHGGVR